MYTPIPDLPEQEHNGGSTSKNNDSRTSAGDVDVGGSSCSSPSIQTTTTEEQKQTRYLIIATWIASVLFGLYAAVHYIWPAIVNDNWEVWDSTDPGLYRRGCTMPNILMVIHLTGGVYLMFAGPIQLIPSIRNRNINLHRWVGRFYILAAVTASAFALSFCLTYSNGRDNPHENAGNVILGISAFTCAIQSYRYIKKNNIEEHKIWSYRLYAVVLGALLYRLYVAIYWGLVLYTPLPFSTALNNSIFYLMALPNLAIVELIRNKKLYPIQNLNLMKICTVFITVASALIFFFNWLPAMIGMDTADESSMLVGTAEGDINHSKLCNLVSSVRAICILVILVGSSIVYLVKVR